jgi:hypothetical protein
MFLRMNLKVTRHISGMMMVLRSTFCILCGVISLFQGNGDIEGRGNAKEKEDIS